jgi:PRTRC genetic system protein C
MTSQANIGVNALQRTFKIGSAVLGDPLPGFPLDDVQQLLSATYPQVRWTRLYESDGMVVGDAIQYEFIIPPPKTNG